MLDFSVTFIITIINITILFLILRKFLFKPVTKFMADRAKRVQDSIDQAQIERDQAHKLLAEYEAKLKQVESEIEQMLKSAKEDAARKADRVIAEGKEQAADILAAAQRQIEADHEAALTKFKLEAAALVMAAVSKLAVKDFSNEDNRRYVNMLLDELAAKKGRN